MNDATNFTTPLKSQKPNTATNWLDLSKNFVIGGLLLIIIWFVVPIVYSKIKGSTAPTIGNIIPNPVDTSPAILPVPSVALDTEIAAVELAIAEQQKKLQALRDTAKTKLTEVRPEQVNANGVVTRPKQVILNEERVDLSDIGTGAEVFIREDTPNNGNRDTVTALQELEQVKEEIARNREMLNEITRTINQGITVNGGPAWTEEAIRRIVREQIAYYWKNHDAVASKRGYRNVIKWEDVNY